MFNFDPINPIFNSFNFHDFSWQKLNSAGANAFVMSVSAMVLLIRFFHALSVQLRL